MLHERVRFARAHTHIALSRNNGPTAAARPSLCDRVFERLMHALDIELPLTEHELRFGMNQYATGGQRLPARKKTAVSESHATAICVLGWK